MSYTITKGVADEITLSNEKKRYTGANSLMSKQAKELGLNVKVVKFKGCCIYSNINDRANDKHHFPIEIDGINIYTFIDNIADDNEPII